MKIGVMGNTFKGYGIKRIHQEANKKHKAVKLFPKKLFLTLDTKLDGLMDKSHKHLGELDVVIPRFSTRNWDFDILAVKHLEQMGVPIVNSAECIVTCKNKYLTSLALKKKRIPQPAAAVALSSDEMIKFIAKMKKPVVLKLLSGSMGVGISRIYNKDEAEEWLDTFRKFNQALYIQEYIDHGGVDYRYIVIDGKVVFAYQRIAKDGGWKTNISLGSKSAAVKRLDKDMEEIALKCTKAVKADIAGVDMVRDPAGVIKVLEVNSFPGFSAPEKKLGQNIAKKIVHFAVKKARR